MHLLSQEHYGAGLPKPWDQPGPEPTDTGTSREATMQLLTLNSRGSVQILLSVSSIDSLLGKSSFLFVIIKCSSIF